MNALTPIAPNPTDERVPGTGFRQIGSVLSPFVHKIVEAAIRTVEAEGDPARAAHMRRTLAEFQETRHGP